MSFKINPVKLILILLMDLSFFMASGQEPDGVLKTENLISCSDLVIEILESTEDFEGIKTHYSKVEKTNPNFISWGIIIEGSPLHPADGSRSYSENYELAIFEKLTYHSNTVERYEFNPRTKKLRKYHVSSLSYEDLNYDPKTLEKFLSNCHGNKNTSIKK